MGTRLTSDPVSVWVASPAARWPATSVGMIGVPTVSRIMSVVATAQLMRVPLHWQSTTWGATTLQPQLTESRGWEFLCTPSSSRGAVYQSAGAMKTAPGKNITVT